MSIHERCHKSPCVCGYDQRNLSVKSRIELSVNILKPQFKSDMFEPATSECEGHPPQKTQGQIIHEIALKYVSDILRLPRIEIPLTDSAIERSYVYWGEDEYSERWFLKYTDVLQTTNTLRIRGPAICGWNEALTISLGLREWKNDHLLFVNIPQHEDFYGRNCARCVSRVFHVKDGNVEGWDYIPTSSDPTHQEN